MKKMNNNWMNGFGSKANCHTGNPVVFTVDGVAIHAGGHTRSGGYHVMSPAPDLAIGPAQVMDRSSNRTVAPDGFTCGDHVDGASSHIISIDWPDFGIPQDVGREFWVALVDDIKRLDIKTVSTQCVGGHGGLVCSCVSLAISWVTLSVSSNLMLLLSLSMFVVSTVTMLSRASHNKSMLLTFLIYLWVSHYSNHLVEVTSSTL